MKRYDLISSYKNYYESTEMKEQKDGDWVKYEDVHLLLDRVAELEGALEEANHISELHFEGEGYEDTYDALKSICRVIRNTHERLTEKKP